MKHSKHSNSTSIPRPTFADVQRRRNQLLAWQASQKSQSTARREKGSPAEDPSPQQDDALTRNAEPPEALAILAEIEDLKKQIGETVKEPENLDEEYTITVGPPPPSLREAAFHGLAGQVVRGLAPYTEADPTAILLQFLAAFGNLVGPGPHCTVGPTRHGLNLFVVLVGESSKARKGTSWRLLAALFAEAEPDWVARRVTAARPTAYGILHALRDQQPATDRRLFLVAEEFTSVLHMLAHRNGQFSPLLRCAWDGGDLALQYGNRLLLATAAHLSMVAHITEGELNHSLRQCESQNGFANRCLWTSVRRSQSLPDGGALPPGHLNRLAQDLRPPLQWAQNQNKILFERTPAANRLWNECYPALSQSRLDIYGAATSRGEAQVLRLSAIYAALDATAHIDVPHLQAALAVWDYCQESARLFFDASPVDPVARRISQALDDSRAGLSKRQISGLFHRHVTRERIDLALQHLSALGYIRNRIEPGRGRPTTLWATARDKEDRGLAP